MEKSIGHLDFVVNGGKLQPDCFTKRQLIFDSTNKTRNDHKRQVVAENNVIVNGNFSVMGNVKSCSHTKAKLYYLESIRSQCQFTSCSKTTCARMGYYASNTISGRYDLTTKKFAPYC